MRKMTAVLLSAVTVFTAGYQAYAKDLGPKYVSEVQIGCGEEGKRALKEAGFTVSSQNLNEDAGYNENNNAQTPVYLGYKTTVVREDAITDMALMNMNGNYSFNDYEMLLESQKEEIDAMLEIYTPAIEEFREKYKEDLNPAKNAYELLNLYYEEDTGKKLGEFFISDETTAEQLQTLFLQGNYEFLSYAETFILYGLHDSEDTLYDRLSALDIDDEYPRSLDSTCRLLISAISDLQIYFDAVDMVAEKLGTEMTDEEFSSYLEENRETLGTEQIYKITEGYAIQKIAGGIDYAGAVLSDGEEVMLLDILRMDETELYQDNYYYIRPLASALTKGQISCLNIVGLRDILLVENYEDTDLQEIYEKAYENVPEDYEAVSVYYNVDRSMFEPDGIALTDAAAKTSNDDSGSTWTSGDATKLEEKYSQGRTAVFIGGIVAGSISFLAGAYCLYYYIQYLADYFVTDIYVAQEGFFNTVFVNPSSLLTTDFYNCYFGTAFTVFVVLALVCVAAFLIYYFWSSMFGYDEILVDRDYAYTRKPRAIVNAEEDDAGDTYYVFYYAVKDTGGEIADLNGNDTKNPEWLCLYTTKDTRQGDPITADFKFNTDGKISSGYSCVHNFTKGAEGVRTAFNLNYGTAKSDCSHYMFIRHLSEAESLNYTGSVFGEYSTLLVAMAAFALGAALSGGIVYVLGKKKEQVEA